MEYVMFVMGVVGGSVFGWWMRGPKVVYQRQVIEKSYMDDLPEIEPVRERDLLAVGALAEDDACVRVPLHIAEGMRKAKEMSIGSALEMATAKEEALGRAVWMAAGYVRACREFQRLWIGLREKGGRRRKKAEG